VLAQMAFEPAVLVEVLPRTLRYYRSNDMMTAAPELTVLCLVRHGHATTAACIDRLYTATRQPFRLIYVDIASPPEIREALDREVAARPGTRLVRELMPMVEYWRADDIARAGLRDYPAPAPISRANADEAVAAAMPSAR
jgi:hypothetical protein